MLHCTCTYQALGVQVLASLLSSLGYGGQTISSYHVRRTFGAARFCWMGTTFFPRAMISSWRAKKIWKDTRTIYRHQTAWTCRRGKCRQLSEFSVWKVDNRNRTKDGPGKKTVNLSPIYLLIPLPRLPPILASPHYYQTDIGKNTASVDGATFATTGASVWSGGKERGDFDGVSPWYMRLSDFVF